MSQSIQASEVEKLVNQSCITVLHVDDEPDFGDLVATFLEREDDCFTVETATSASEALDSIRDRPPDCIVSDYDMPGKNGIEFLQSVRDECPELPFILFTGKGSEEVASEAISAGVTDYLRKGGGSEQYEILANRIIKAFQTRQLAEKLSRQEELMRLTEVAGETGGFELDRESDTVLLTAGARRIIGRPDQHEIPLTEAVELFHPEDREDIQQTLDKAFETGEKLHETWRLRPGDGDERLLDITITPVVENGEVRKILGTGHDITEQKKRKQKLELVETLFEHAQECQFIIEVAGGEFELCQANKYYKRTVGLSPGEPVTGQTPTDLFGEAGGEEILDRYTECDETRESVTYTVEVPVPEEGTVYRTILAPVVTDDELTHIVGTARDITDNKDHEETSTA